MLRMYHACKEALKIIGDVSTATISTPTPAPVRGGDWLPPATSYSGPQTSPGNMRKAVPPPVSRGPPPAPASRPAPSVPGRPGGSAPPPPGRPGGALPPPLIPSSGRRPVPTLPPRLPDRPSVPPNKPDLHNGQHRS